MDLVSKYKIENFVAKLKAMAEEAAAEQAHLGEQFNDPVASKTDWSPCKGGGTNFRTHKLVVSGAYSAAFKPSIGGLIFYSIFLLAGLGALGLGMFFLVSGIDTLSGGLWIVLLVGLIFSAAGGAMLYFGTKPIVFDLATNRLIRGRSNKTIVMDYRDQKGIVPLDQLYALQILAERVSGSDNSYYSYELNLVMYDGRRVNVVDHGDLKRLRKDAQQLAQMLGKPLWDVA